jgi:hypothetical protein
MNRTKILFFSFIVIEMLVALFLELLTDRMGPLMTGVADAQFQYIFGIVCALSAIVAAFLAIKKKQMNPILRMAVVTSGVNLILFDYYFFFDTNLLYLLLVLAVAYMFIWPATEN